MSTRIIIKQSPNRGSDNKTFRAYSPDGRRDQPLGVSASTTGNPEHGALCCAAKTFIKFAEPGADRDEIETRIALKEIIKGSSIWQATLNAPMAGSTAATGRTDYWRSIADEMPDDEESVLVYMPDSTEPVWLGYHEGDTWYDVNTEAFVPRVTHWMPIPEPPEV